MEHSLHLAAHHFVEALNHCLLHAGDIGPFAEATTELLLASHRVAEHADEEDDDPEPEDYTPNDILGKVLALVALVH